MKIAFPLTLALAVLSLAPLARAQNLVDLHKLAQQHDATYQAAKAQYEATRARADQALAGLLPTANLGYSASYTQTESNNPQSERDYQTRSASVTASQPLYRPGNWVLYQQGKKQLDLAQAQLDSAEQDLIIRVSQAYFDVLAAQDTLAFVKAQKTAVAEQLASAKRNFEVGTATITDTREAQARFDLVVAQEIGADNDLRVKKIALDTLVGKTDAQPKGLAAPVKLPPLQPNTVNPWVSEAEQRNPLARQARANLDIAKLETDRAKAGHKPTLDLSASHSRTHNLAGSALSASSSHTQTSVVGLSFNLPLFAGFATQNRVRETLALESKAQSDLEATQRSAAQSTRSAFFGVLSGLSQVAAFEAAEASSQSALDANKLGYQVGVRINIDVLNSQSQLFQTKRDLAQARYNVLLNGLRLRQANGTLANEHLNAVNALLQP